MPWSRQSHWRILVALDAVSDCQAAIERAAAMAADHSPDIDWVEHTLYEGQWLIFFLARRRIDSGEQLIIDYGKAYWENGYREMID